MTTYERGAAVLVRFPHSDLVPCSRRPALVAQDERIATALRKTLGLWAGRGLKHPAQRRRFAPGAGKEKTC